MPFRVGEIWLVGEPGSFYGNNRHCNYYNAYYATDWNRPDNIDIGKAVVAVADGVVSAVQPQPCPRYEPSDPITRYGCYVQIDHANNYRTLYAHLQEATANVGNTVRAGNMIGELLNFVKLMSHPSMLPR
jgi:murein DD-endopeptidase MepM/ murein hydrolase activator NlpD